MAIRQTVAKQYMDTSSPVNASFGVITLAGSTIVVALNGYDGGGSVDAAASDDGANTYTKYASTDAAARTLFYVVENAAAGTQITLTPVGNINGFWQAWEINGAPASSLDQAPVFYSDPDSDPDASVTITPSTYGCVAIAACGTREAFGTFALTGPSGWDSDHLDTTQSGALISSSMAHLVGVNTTPQTAAWTHNDGSPVSAGILLIRQNVSFGSGLLLRMVSE